MLFRQRRIGKDGSDFTVLKFRTMHADAEERLADLLEQQPDRATPDVTFFKLEDDPRITRVGRSCAAGRSTSCPSSGTSCAATCRWSVPGRCPARVDDLQAWQRRRLRVRPGLTGMWQVSGRSYLDADEAVRMDIFYIENWSLGYDLLILAQTVVAVLARRGAH